MIRNATISPCGTYRYFLGRVWDDKLPVMIFVMLNPSTADAKFDDPTIRRCISFAKRDGFGGIAVINLYAFRTSSPKELYAFRGDRQGPENSGYWAAVLDLHTKNKIVCAWGAHERAGTMGQGFTRAARNRDVPLYCLGVTSGGSPRHPLYVKGDQPLLEYAA